MWKKTQGNTKNYGEKEKDEIICLSHGITLKFKTISKMYLRKKDEKTWSKMFRIEKEKLMHKVANTNNINA